MVKREAPSAKLQAVLRGPSYLRRPRSCWMLASCVLLAACGFALAASPALAQLNTGLDFGTATGLSTQDIRVTVAKIIRAALGLLGILAVAITAYGGFLWMTSGGNEEQLVNAKQWLTNGAIGLTIILLSFSITQFVLSRLLQAGFGGGTVITAGRFEEDVFLTGALGAGPIESHYPARSATDIARNTRIFITFREAIDPTSLAADTNANETIGTTGERAEQFDNYQDLIRPEAIQIMSVGANVDPDKLTPLAREQDATAFAAEAAKLVPAGVAIAADGRTIVLAPVAVAEDGRVRTTESGYAERALLGSAAAPTAYLVRLTGAIKKSSTRADGTREDLFTGAFRDGYTWDFTVSTTMDLTPPKITSVVPFPDADRDAVAEDGSVTVRGNPDQPQNVTVQVNFNEAMDPTVTTGAFEPDVATKAFGHLAVSTDGEDSGRIVGTFAISNQYRTVEFTTDDPCAQNSCGGTVYCLPGNADLLAWANTAQLEAGGPAGLPFSGVMDAAGNALDGNGNGRTDGPGAPGTRRFHIGESVTENTGASDSAEWSFQTTDTLDLTAPEIREVVHYGKQDQRIAATTAQGGGTLADLNDISLTRPIEVLFSKLMSGGVASGFMLSEAAGCDVQSGMGCLWFTGSATHEDTTTPRDAAVDATRVTIAHASFREARSGFPMPEYRVRADASVTDIYQNCFYSAEEPVGPQGPHGGQSCIVTPRAEACTQIP